MAGAILPPTRLLSGRQASCQARRGIRLGSHHCQSRLGLPRETSGWPQTLVGGLSHPGVFWGLLHDPSALRRPQGCPGWRDHGNVLVLGVAWWTLLVRGDPGQSQDSARGDPDLYCSGAMVNGGGSQPPPTFKSMGRAAQR
jgi:hypothetical protein